MVGFIGERAKRRRRNLVLFFIIIFVGIIFYLLLPLLKSSEIMPTDNFLPSDDEILSPELKNTIEDLELKIFDKQQKIIFRDMRIKKFKDEIKILSLKNKSLLESISDLKNRINLSSDNKIAIKDKDELMIKNHLKEVAELEEKILQLKNTNKTFFQQVENYRNNIISIKKESKKIINNNLKLKNINDENDIKINELENFIEEQNLIIQLLKDKNPHN
jgi:hypothetical protein